MKEKVEYSPSLWPDITTIAELRKRHFIDQDSPQWWSVDNTPDPREYVSIDTYLGSLEHLGICKTTMPDWRMTASTPSKPKDVYLYPQPTVPMSVLELPIDGHTIPFLVTARPYHEKELESDPHSFLLEKFTDIHALREYSESGGALSLFDHFYPHVRGLFAGQRGNHFFWYPLFMQAKEPVTRALKKRDLEFMHVYIDGIGWGTKTHGKNWYKLKNDARIDIKKLKHVEASSGKPMYVSAEEFIANYRTNDCLVVRYPVTVTENENEVMIIISNLTHAESSVRKPTVLGIYAHNGGTGYTRRSGIARIKDETLAMEISKKISEDFSIPVDTVLFTPHPGRPLYERISAI